MRAGAVTCLSLEAGLVHLWYTPESFMEWWGYGWFFLAAAVGQAAYGPVLMLRGSQAVVQAGIWANAAIVALYVTTRVWGIPLGPHAAVVEPVGAFDLVCVLSEVAVVILLVPLLAPRHRRATVNALMALGVLLWALRIGVGAALA